MGEIEWSGPGQLRIGNAEREKAATDLGEHLAAGRPMIATRGFEELLREEPFLRLVDSADEMMQALEDLRATGFRDGREALRRLASQGETWEVRAATMKRR